MKKISSVAINCSIRYYISSIITFFIYFSVTVIATGAFTNVTGYTAYSAENNEVLYHYYYEQGEDTQKAQFEAQGIEVSTVALRSTLEGTAKMVTDVIAQIAGGLITLGFVHNSLWNLGAGDNNLVNFGHMVYDRFRGAKIGLLASLPGFVVWLVTVIAKLGLLGGKWFVLFRAFNYQTFLPFNAIFGQSTVSTDLLSWGQIFGGLIIIFILPIISEIFYILGYKKFTFNNLIYKKER